MTLLLLLTSGSHAASLDLIEVGGAWGTPAATNPTALWWNPAGLAVGGGTQVHVEVAPTIGKVTAARDNPDYGELDPAYFQQGYPETYDYSGTDTLRYVGAVPFVGVSSDLGVDGLGLGLGLMVPSGKGGKLDDPWGANRFALREGSIQHIYTTLGAGYQLADKVALGLSASLVNSRWRADTDTTILPDLAAGVSDILGPGADTSSFQAGYAERREYTTTTIFELKDTGFTFGGGVHVTPIEELGISLAYNHGLRLVNQGELTFIYQCPPEWDATGRAAAEDIGTCDTTAVGEGTIAYKLPARLHLGVAVQPVDRLRLELMGAYVMWSAFTDYDVTTEVAPDQFPDAPDNTRAAIAAQMSSQVRQWARDNRDTFFVGLDAKGRLSDLLLIGGRVTYDRAAVPDTVVSANNYDADTVLVSGLVDLTPVKPVSFSLSYSNQILAKRVVTDSAYAVTVDIPSNLRYFYPSSNGTYTGSIHRLGVTLRGRFGQ